MNIIADVAGRYDALMRLVDKMPQEEYLFLGDLCDRGLQSKQVIEWVMKHGKSVKGNHEDMFIDWYENTGRYPMGCWGWNGGDSTAYSYHPHDPISFNEARKNIPEEHIEWLKSLPKHFENEFVFASHAPLAARVELQEALDSEDLEAEGVSVLWHRGFPKKREKFQVFGHNSHWGLTWFTGDKAVITKQTPNPPAGAWAVCLDDSGKRKLTGLNINGDKMTIYQELYY